MRSAMPAPTGSPTTRPCAATSGWCCASTAGSCRRPTSRSSIPPRGGLSGRAVRRILELGPPTLVYVSCQPATFADNAARFVEGGYTLEWVRPVDMFPQTPHIEAVARFTR